MYRPSQLTPRTDPSIPDLDCDVPASFYPFPAPTKAKDNHTTKANDNHIAHAKSDKTPSNVQRMHESKICTTRLIAPPDAPSGSCAVCGSVVNLRTRQRGPLTRRYCGLHAYPSGSQLPQPSHRSVDAKPKSTTDCNDRESAVKKPAKAASGWKVSANQYEKDALMEIYSDEGFKPLPLNWHEQYLKNYSRR